MSDSNPTPPFTRSRWTSLILALGLLVALVALQLIVGIAVAIGAVLLAMMAGMSSSAAIRLATGGALLGGASAIASLLTVGLIWLVVSRAGRRPFREPMALVPSRTWPLWTFVPAALVFNLLFDGLTTWLNFPPLPEELVSLYRDPVSVVVLALTSVLVAPIAEEWLFRGVLFNALERFVPTWLTVLLTALLFGAPHVMTYGLDGYSLLQVIVTGLILGGLRAWTQSLWPSITFHAVVNLYTTAWVVVQLYILT